MFNAIVSLVLVGVVLGLPGASSGPPSKGAVSSGGGAEASQGSCDAGKLLGLWAGERYSMKILADMTYRASGSPNMASIDVTGTLKVDKCDVEILDTSGRYACPSTDVGKYTFTVTETTLAFTLVSDPCDGRRRPLTAGPLTKK